MQAVRDYLARLFAAVFLCPVAVGVHRNAPTSDYPSG